MLNVSTLVDSGKPNALVRMITDTIKSNMTKDAGKCADYDIDSNVPCEKFDKMAAVNPSFWKVEKGKDGAPDTGADTPVAQEELPIQ